MPRDPNSPIPGFEDEFTGTVGKEKRIHRTHWGVDRKPKLRHESPNDAVWVQTGPGRYRLIRKEGSE